MSIITKLTAILTADSAQFESGIKKAKGSFSGFQGALIKGSALIAGAVATVGTVLVALGIKSAKSIDANVKLANSLGFSAKEFKNFSIVAEESGVSQEQFTTAFVKTQKVLFDANSGLKAAQDTFKGLGLSVSDLIKLSPADQFIAISEALDKVKNPTEKTALSMELLGKGGRGVINMLGDLRDKYDEAAAFADKFNISVNDVDSKQVEAAGDAFGRVGMIAQGAGNTVAVTFSPLVEAASKSLVDAAISGEDFGYAIKYGMTIAAMAVDVVRKSILGFRALFAGTIQGVLEIAARAKEALTGDGGVLRGAADLAKEDVRAIQNEINNFESSVSKLDKIYAGSRDRATAAAGNKSGGSEGDISAGIEESNKKTLELKDNTKSLADVYDEFSKSSGDAIDGLISDLGRGGNALQSFRNFAVSILQDVLKSLNGGNTIGGSLGGLIAGGLTNILSGGSLVSQGLTSGGGISPLYSGLAAVTGSYATGIAKVPYDMNVRVHRGEAITPASQVDDIGASGAQTINIDARGSQIGVEEKIRQVMNEVNALRRETPKIALNVVSDQNRRNPNFVR